MNIFDAYKQIKFFQEKITSSHIRDVFLVSLINIDYNFPIPCKINETYPVVLVYISGWIFIFYMLKLPAVEF